jgi:hypothetical protein
MDELHDVAAQTPSNNDGLFYNSTNSLWENKSIATALGYTPANAATTLTINGVTFDLSANRTFTVGSVTGSGASGQIAYWNGTSTQTGSNNLFWDATNSRLGIGTNSPAVQLDVRTSVNLGTEQIRITNTSTGSAAVTGIALQASTAYGSLFATSSGYTTVGILQANRIGFYMTHPFAIAIVSGDFIVGTGASLTERFRLFGSTGNLLLQNGGTFTDSGERLQVTGTMKVTGASSFGGDLSITANSSGNTLLSQNLTSSTIFVGNAAGSGTVAFELQNTSTRRLRILCTSTNTTFESSNQTGSFIFNNRVSLPASTTTKSTLNIASGTAPTSPNDGDIWYDGTDIKMRIGGVTKTFTLV